MKILFASSEIYPFVKTGGLADVCGALPHVLHQLGADVRLFLPGYDQILPHLKYPCQITKYEGLAGIRDARILFGVLDHPNGQFSAIPTYVLDCPELFSGRHPYIDSQGHDWTDNYWRFGVFSHAAAHLSQYDPIWQADIIHGHDWQCGLIPIYLQKLRSLYAGEFSVPKFLFTIHNIAYQGLFYKEHILALGLSWDDFTPKGLEFYDQISYLKAGINYADLITTVSPTYAKEICDTDLGCGLQGILKARREYVHGILNGIDTEVWDPFSDSLISKNYSSENIIKKVSNREDLVKQFDLLVPTDRPLFGIVSRLTPQKGFDLVLAIAPQLIAEKCAFVVLGNGDKDLEDGFFKLQSQFPNQVKIINQYNENFAHKIHAGADCILMPSRMEPCGLVQLYAMRYGTPPLVRNTGGLADSVTAYNADASSSLLHANGFKFYTDDALSLLKAAQDVIAAFASPKIWKTLCINAMKQDFSWGQSAKTYMDLYQKII